ncbi:ExeM/NucH family extracellular endonuclease [Agaribacter flavus]|uniref:ExeM/NucH family extracellular endonuclease n=1 Tax=Agaribacter flavus TaxID=1902781 RepID=A0ABV7FM29_9ALTE
MNLKQLSLLLSASAAMHSAYAQEIIITGVIDGPLSGGTPKAVELFVSQDIADLSVCGISSANNGGGTTTSPEFDFPAGSVNAGSYIYVASESSNFSAYMGFAPSYTSGAMSVNGDDAIELYCNGVVVDVFGDVNTDGTNQAWEYLDGWAYRNQGTGPDGSSFLLSNWQFSGRNALDGESSNTTAASPFPVGSFADGTIPDPDPDPEPPTGSTCENCDPVTLVKDPDTFDASAYYAAVLTEIDMGITDEMFLRPLLNEAISTEQVFLTYRQVWTALTITDEDPTDTNNVILWYTGQSRAKNLNGGDTTDWNREHSWPQSHGFRDLTGVRLVNGQEVTIPAEAFTDIHHLRATDVSVNNRRGNLDFDASDEPYVEAPGNRVDGDSFEPRDEIKGDVARMMFYMDMRYDGLGEDITPDLVLVDGLTSTGTTELGRLCRLWEWHQADPVDEAERIRHDKIYALQGNRNPFIDFPEWAQYFYATDACSDGNDGGGDGDNGGGDNGGGSNLVSPAESKIIITEILQNPRNVSDANGEWFELYNNSVEAINLNGWTIEDFDSDSFIIDEDLVVAPGHFVILGRNADTSANGGVSIDYAYGSQMALSNGADELVVVDPDGNVVDEIAYDGGPNFPDPNGASMVLVDFSGDNNVGNKWAEDTNNIFSDGDFGTPGSAELPPVTLVITEIMQNPRSVSDGNGEYFEILNTTPTVINLLGYVIKDADNDSHVINDLVFVAGGTYAVFARMSDPAINGGVEAVYEYSGISMGNGTDELIIESPNGDLLDIVEYDNGASFPDPNGASMTLISAALDNNLGSNWFEENVSVYGDGDFGTPGSGPDGLSAGGGSDGGGDQGGGDLELGMCGAEATFISSIQGSASATLMGGQTKVVEAAVTGVFPALGGFYVQEEKLADEDGNPLTSEGLFIEYSVDTLLPVMGDLVRVIGTVKETSGRTSLEASETYLDCAQSINVMSQLATTISLPFASVDAPEAYENMLVEFSDELTISDNDSLVQFGEVIVSNGRLYSPTHLFIAGSEEANALFEENERNQIILDDSANGTPEVLEFPVGGLLPDNTLRVGTKVFGFAAVLDEAFGSYRLRPVNSIQINDVNPRTPFPEIVEGNLKIASFNVLNLFNGDGLGNAFPTSRGADNFAEYERQLAKIVNALVAIDADIVGLMEIENDGFASTSAIAQLVEALNSVLGEGTYDFVDLGAPVGTDEITVAILYKPAKVQATEPAKVLTETNSISDDEGPLFRTTRNRPSVAQRFALTENGRSIVVNVNHFKSKGSSCGAGDDSTNGQGNCNRTRERAAIAVAAWLASEYADEPTVIVGDLNAYAKEDPILALAAAGYTDIAREIEGPFAYSYEFSGLAGSLDYALVNDLAKEDVVDVTEWHINADEPSELDYNDTRRFGRADIDKPLEFINTNTYRASDHDPVVLTLQLETEALLGDFDGDGDIDRRDLAIFVRLIRDPSAVRPEYDFNGDGVVSREDARTLQTLCTKTRCAE